MIFQTGDLILNANLPQYENFNIYISLLCMISLFLFLKYNFDHFCSLMII